MNRFRVSLSWYSWALLAAFLLLSIVALSRTLLLREQLYAQSARRVEQRLEDHVRTWEASLLSRLDAWLDAVVARPDDAASVQADLRAQAPWVESVFVWTPPRPTGRGDVTRARLLFPVPHRRDDQLATLNHPCVVTPTRLLFLGAPPPQIAQAWLRGCAGSPLPVRLEASLSAAQILENSGDVDGAMAALDTGFSEERSVRDGVALGLRPDRVIVHRNRRAELLMTAGRVDDSISRYYETGEQIGELDAPDAAGLETLRWALLAELDQHDQPLLRRRLELGFDRLDRRIRALREVQGQILVEVPGPATTSARLVRDQYADQPYLLYYKLIRLSSGDFTGAALQLDQQQVLADFLASAPEPRSELVIVDPAGGWVLGARRNGRPLAVQVPFSRALAPLRVGVHSDMVSRLSDGSAEQWALPLGIIAFTMIIAFSAFSADIAARRRERELVERQREFTTRVTHELKTPLAGMRVMAENLEIGAFKGDAGREAMARRIQEEADRLTLRIDEVLKLSREREIPRPKPVALGPVLTDLAQVWRPRMEQLGVSLLTEIGDAPPVQGDSGALRDAIGCLLDNALKYRRPDAPEKRVLLRLHQVGKDAVVEVVDNGLGVPAKMRRKIFDRFVRVEGPNRGLSGGHGLGLAQVADVVAAHRGKVTCTEGQEGGARFVVRLPGAPPMPTL